MSVILACGLFCAVSAVTLIAFRIMCWIDREKGDTVGATRPEVRMPPPGHTQGTSGRATPTRKEKPCSSPKPP